MLQYLASVLSRSSQVAADSLKQKPDEKDVLFVVRKVGVVFCWQRLSHKLKPFI